MTQIAFETARSFGIIMAMLVMLKNFGWAVHMGNVALADGRAAFIREATLSEPYEDWLVRMGGIMLAGVFLFGFLPAEVGKHVEWLNPKQAQASTVMAVIMLDVLIVWRWMHHSKRHNYTVAAIILVSFVAFLANLYERV